MTQQNQPQFIEFKEKEIKEKIAEFIAFDKLSMLNNLKKSTKQILENGHLNEIKN